jgi:DNA end-binding protein Ku
VVTTTLELGVGLRTFSIPVKVRKVSQKQDIRIDRASPDGNPLGNLTIDKVTGEQVANEDIRRGKFDGEQFHEIPAEMLAVIEEQTKLDTLAVENFIPVKDVPFERASDAYFLAPDTNPRPLRLLYEALSKTKRAGVGKLVFRSRQQPFVIYPAHGGVFLLTMSFAADFAEADEAGTAISQVDVPKDQVAMAVELVESLASDADVLDTFEDDLIPLKSELVERALAGQKIEARTKQKKATVAHDGLMESLRESLAEAQASRKSSPRSAGRKKQRV